MLTIFIIISTIGPSYADIGPRDVIVTPEYVQATAYDSCGHGVYQYKTGTFLNYCPVCHHYGCLVRSWKQPEEEGQWTCINDGTDWCMQDGWEKMPTGNRLVPYTPPQPVKVNAANVEQSQLDIYKETIETHWDNL